MSDTKTKTERLLLNTTPEERVGLKTLLERSRHSSNSDLMREAFEQYLGFHKRVLAGEEIIVTSASGKGGHSIYIPIKWEDAAYTDVDQNSEVGEVKEAPARKVLEIRLSPDLKKRLQQFVASGYAPSLTALAGGALEIHSEVLTAAEEGNEVRARKQDGSEVILLEPSRRFAAVTTSHSGWAIGQLRNLEGGFRWEEVVDAEVIHIISPHATVKRYPTFSARVEAVMLQNYLKQVIYKWPMGDKSDAFDLSQWLFKTFNGKLLWSAFTADQQSALEARMQRLNFDSAMAEQGRKCPVWILSSLYAVRSKTEGDTNLVRVREAFNASKDFKTYWIAEMKDESLEGFEFAGMTDVLGDSPASAELVGMHPKNMELVLSNMKDTDIDELPVPPPDLFNAKFDAWKIAHTGGRTAKKQYSPTPILTTK